MAGTEPHGPPGSRAPPPFPDHPSAAEVAFPDTLQNPTRRRLMDLVQETPGLNIQEIADALGVQRTAANHHVRRLLKDGFLVTHWQGPHMLHFPATIPLVQRTVLSVLRIPSVWGIANELLGDPSLSGGALASRLRMNPRTVRRAVRTLKSHGLLQVEPSGTPPRRTSHLHPELRVALAHLTDPGRPGAARLPPLVDGKSDIR